MTPEEYAKNQREMLLSSERLAARDFETEFNFLKSEISKFLLSEIPSGTPSIPKLHERNLLERIRNRISREIDKRSTSLSSIVENSQKQVIEQAAKSLAQYLKLDASIFDIDRQAIRKLIGSASGNSPLSKLFSRLKLPVAEKAKGELIMGFGLGESAPKIAKRLQDTIDLSKSHALTISRTETNEAYRAATRDFYDTAEIPQYVWMSVLNSNTCVICWYLHGRKFKTNRKVFSHPNCRCVLIPLLKNQKPIITGAEKFKNLPEGFQKQIVGAKKHELYKQGSDLSDFIGMRKSDEFGDRFFVKSLENLA